MIRLHVSNNTPIKDTNYEQCTSNIANSTDEEGLRLTTINNKVYYIQNDSKLYITGTRDWPNDIMYDLKLLPDSDTLDNTKRWRYTYVYYRKHYGIDTLTGFGLGGTVALKSSLV